MKIIFIFLFFLPTIVNAQFESRLHVLGGTNIQLTTDSYLLYKNYVVGLESIIGFRVNKLFAGVGAGMQFTGNDYFAVLDNFGNEIKKVNLYNIDVPLFWDFTYGKKFYVEGKIGYSFKLSNIKNYMEIESHTMFNSLGVGYSIPVGTKMYIDITIEGKFNYSFVNTVSKDYTSIYFLPIAKLGLRFAKL